MNFSVVLFSMVATALAASIPLETSTVVREPSLTTSVLVNAGDKQNRNNEAGSFLIENMNYLYQQCNSIKNEIINNYIECIRDPSTCPSAVIRSVDAGDRQSRNFNAFTILTLSLTLLTKQCSWVKKQIIFVYSICLFDPNVCSEPAVSSGNIAAILDGLDSVLEKFTLRDISQSNDFEETFMFPPASTIVLNAVNPNNRKHSFPVTVPTFWNPNVNIPLFAFHNQMPNAAYSSASFIPYLNSLTAYSDPSFTNTLAQNSKGFVPAGTLLETTPYFRNTTLNHSNIRRQNIRIDNETVYWNNSTSYPVAAD